MSWKAALDVNINSKGACCTLNTRKKWDAMRHVRVFNFLIIDLLTSLYLRVRNCLSFLMIRNSSINVHRRYFEIYFLCCNCNNWRRKINRGQFDPVCQQRVNRSCTLLITEYSRTKFVEGPYKCDLHHSVWFSSFRNVYRMPDLPHTVPIVSVVVASRERYEWSIYTRYKVSNARGNLVTNSEQRTSEPSTELMNYLYRTQHVHSKSMIKSFRCFPLFASSYLSIKKKKKKQKRI